MSKAVAERLSANTKYVANFGDKRGLPMLSGRLIALLILWLMGIGLYADSGQTDRPNIIIIMSDDMGYSDVGSYGGEIDTPNLDRLAKNGLRFSQFYNASRCCPTRASLLTGQFPHKVGVGRNGVTMNREGVTIAEVLGNAGYNTAMFGKWHLSVMDTLDDKEKQLAWLNHQYTPDRPFAPLDSYPVNRGFDEHYGVIWGVVNFFDPYSLVEGTQPVETVPEDYYFTDALNERSAEAVKRLSDKEAPFFMYVAHAAPHWPLHALPEDIAKYEKEYLAGWDSLRKERFERQVEIKLFNPGIELPEVQSAGQDWDALSEEKKRFMARKMAVHAAMVDRLDQGVGMLIEALEEKGELANTLIMFLSDNGASPELPKAWGPGLDRPSETRDGEKIHYKGFEEAGAETTFAGLGRAWANATNTPFRYWKAEQYRGGNHTPFIVHWPKGLKENPGAVTDQPGHVIDILPTLLEITGVDYPHTFNGNPLNSLDGKSLVSIFRGKNRDGHEAIYFEHMGGKAMIQGDWKLVSLKKQNASWALYNIANDPTETHDLSKEYPDKLKEMVQEWSSWAESVGVDSN